MTQQIINVGTADKGNGDPLRTAFVKINSNFNELYASLGADFENLETSLIPSQDDTYNLGSTTKRWRSLYLGANTLYLDNIPLTVEGGILKVNGVSINGGDLGKLKIQDGFIGTVDNPDTGGWGDYGLTLDPGGESQAFISLPSVPAQGEGAALIIQNKGDSTSIVQVFGRGGVQVVTNTGEAEEVFEFGDDGKLRLPMGGDILNANGDSVLGIQGLTVDQAASRTNIGKSVTESVNTVTSRLFVLPNQVGLESISDPAGPNNSSTGLVVVGNSAIELSLVEQSIGGDAVVALAINGTGVEIAQGDGVTTEYLSINTSGLTFPISANVSAVGLGLRGDVGESLTYLQLPSNSNADTNPAALANDNGNVRISALSQSVGIGRNWIFNTDGTLTLPGNGTITEGTASANGNTVSTIELTPAGGGDVNQRLVIYPTAAEGNHIHITSGDQSVTDLFLGNDSQFFKVAAGGSNFVGINGYNWTFDNTGTLTLPVGHRIIGATADNNGFLQWSGNNSGDGGGYTTLDLVPDDTRYEAFIVLDPTAPNHIHIRAGGTQDNSSAELYLGGENSHFAVGSGLNPQVWIKSNQSLWQFANDGTLYLGSTYGAIFTDQTTGKITIGDGLGPNGAPSMPSSIIEIGGNDNAFRISRGNGTNNPSWNFGEDGDLTLPIGSIKHDTTGGFVTLEGPLYSQMVEGPGGGIATVSNGIKLLTHRPGDNLDRAFNFSWDGALYMPYDSTNNQVGAIEWRRGSVYALLRGTNGGPTYVDGRQIPPGLQIYNYNSPSGFSIRTQGDSVGANWFIFDTDGSLSIPGDIKSEGDINIDINLSDSTLRRWQFGEDGNLTFPDNTNQSTAWSRSAAAVQSSAPSSPVTGQLWYDTDDGNTYVWTGSAWVDSNPAVAAATVDITDTNGIDTNYFITFVETRGSGQYLRADVDLFFNSWSNTLTAGNVTTGILKIDDGAHEKFQAKADATGTVTHDCASGHVFYHTSPDANWTANFTNLNLNSGYATAVTLIIVQGGTGYYPSAVQIGGVSQTLNWQANTTPTPSTNRTDVVTFSIINNSGTYIVLGQLTGF